MTGEQSPEGRRNDARGGIIFSLRDGEVWSSWHGWPEAVRLGPVADVAAMMEDFLRQREVGQRLLDSGEGSKT